MEEEAIKLTRKEIKVLKKDVKKELKTLSLLPPPPFEMITPAPKLSHLSAAELCNKVAPLLVNMDSIVEFEDVMPSVASSEAIYEALFLLANIGRKISDSDKLSRDTLAIQLRNNVSSSLKSCALIANGNKALYLLIGSPAKRKSVISKKKLGACVFKLNLKKGRGMVGVSCKAVPGAKGYTIWYGEGEFDRATWKCQPGGASQIIKAEPGAKLYFMMIAFKGNGSEGDESNVQGCNVPFL